MGEVEVRGERPEFLGRVGQWLRGRLPDSQRHLVLWVICGVACGLVAVAFHVVIDLVWMGVKWVSAEAEARGGAGVWGYVVLVLAPALAGLLTGVVVKRMGPGVAGSGIPQTKHTFHMGFGRFRLRDAVARFLVGAISVGGGMSLGREGPTAHICASVAARLAKGFGLAKERVRAIVPAGMGAGIAAAFNTPVSAMFFVFEELFDEFSSKAIFGILVAVVVAAAVDVAVLGQEPTYVLESVSHETGLWMFICIPLGLVAGVFGHGFVTAVLGARSWFKRLDAVPAWLRPALGGLAVGLIGVGVLEATGRYGVFGLGYTDLSDALNGRFGGDFLGALVLLLVAKIVATVLSYSSGGSGGLFAPSLFLGGILGAVVGLAGQGVFGYGGDVVSGVALLGMGTVFAAVIRCPMTSIMIVFELTRNYSLILPLMVGNMLAYVIAVKLRPVPLYDALLIQDGISLKKMPSYQGQQDWRNLPVSAIMTFDPFSVRWWQTAEVNLAQVAANVRKGYPVVGREGELVGFVLHSELEGWAERAGERTLMELMGEGRGAVTVTPETTVREAAKVMLHGDVQRVAVMGTGEERRLHGVLTINDIARQQNAVGDVVGR